MIERVVGGMLLALLAGEGDVTPGDNCPGAESCCLQHDARACSNQTCCEAVCKENADCCAVAWSTECVTLAQSLCGGLCQAVVCPGPGDCCAEHGGAGCEVPSCCASVCTAMPSCCTDSWGSACASLAEERCGPLCTPASGCLGTGNCCLSNGSPGCDDPECCSTICALDSFCCSTRWDDVCARTANQLCGDGGGAYCDWCPSEGNCCAGRETPGCERSACCALICSGTSHCCTEFWDAGCALAAGSVCAATACLCESFGELDEQMFVNLSDAAHFFNCFTGDPGGPIFDPCACADEDGDGDVDLSDYLSFVPFFVAE